MKTLCLTGGLIIGAVLGAALQAVAFEQFKIAFELTGTALAIIAFGAVTFCLIHDLE